MPTSQTIYYTCTECQRFTKFAAYCPHCHFRATDGIFQVAELPDKLATLICGCCGNPYESPNRDCEYDSDLGYGRCGECQDDYQTHNEKLLDEGVRLIESKLSEKNLEKWRTLSLEAQRSFVINALNSGALKFRIPSGN